MRHEGFTRWSTTPPWWGVCTRTDFYDALQDLRLPAIPLSEVLHAPVITVRESDSLMTALWTFLRDPVKRIVVVSDEDGTEAGGDPDAIRHLDPRETEFASISLGAAKSRRSLRTPDLAENNMRPIFLLASVVPLAAIPESDEPRRHDKKLARGSSRFPHRMLRTSSNAKFSAFSIRDQEA